jgi:hypothetical protein
MGASSATSFTLAPETAVDDDTIKVVVVAALPATDVIVIVRDPDVLDE